MRRAFKDLSLHQRAFIRALYRSLPEPWSLPEVVDADTLRKAIFWKAFDSRRRPFERAFTNSAARLLKRIGAEVSKTYRYSRSLPITEQVLQQELSKWLPGWYTSCHTEVENHFLQYLRERVTTKAFKADDEEPEEIDIYDLPELLEWNEQVTATRIVNVTRTTMAGVRRVVERSLDNGASIDVIAIRLQDSFNFSRVRAERIARTEVIAASNAANFYGAVRFIPDLDTKDWISTNDNRTRATHIAAGGSQRDIPYSEPFEVGGSLMMFPGDPSLGAAAREIIQCRCATTFATKPVSIDELIDEARRATRRRRR